MLDVLVVPLGVSLVNGFVVDDSVAQKVEVLDALIYAVSSLAGFPWFGWCGKAFARAGTHSDLR